jgi:signal transduction histidine kinase
MIQKLRLKFVAICMALVTAVMAVVFVSVYVSMERNVEALSRQVLYRVVQEIPSGRNGFVRPDVDINIGGERVLLPYFTVEVWGTNAYVTGGTYASLDDTETLQKILDLCVADPRSEGTIDDYGLRYLRQDNGLFERIAFVDMSMETSILRNMMGPYLRIALVSLLLLLGVSILLSYWAVRPVEKAWKQQRQFLSDASHELKTPLTVILSNAELLESADLEDRSARWADNIHSEARQMKTLVEEMLTLARADNMAPTVAPVQVSLSDVATDCALAFEPVAFEAGKELEYEITDETFVFGDPDKLRRLISVLLDNAIKYGSGTVRLQLQKTEKQARLIVSNPGTPIPPEQLEHLFERFYRADISRGEQSGFGLGLSIAKTLAEEHRGTLKAESDSVSTRFIFTLPLKK